MTCDDVLAQRHLSTPTWTPARTDTYKRTRTLTQSTVSSTNDRTLTLRAADSHVSTQTHTPAHTHTHTLTQKHTLTYKHHRA